MSWATVEVSGIRTLDDIENGVQARDRESRESFSGGDYTA
jgi:hypothetical protein